MKKRRPDRFFEEKKSAGILLARDSETWGDGGEQKYWWSWALLLGCRYSVCFFFFGDLADTLTSNKPRSFVPQEKGKKRPLAFCDSPVTSYVSPSFSLLNTSEPVPRRENLGDIGEYLRPWLPWLISILSGFFSLPPPLGRSSGREPRPLSPYREETGCYRRKWAGSLLIKDGRRRGFLLRGEMWIFEVEGGSKRLDVYSFFHSAEVGCGWRMVWDLEFGGWYRSLPISSSHCLP